MTYTPYTIPWINLETDPLKGHQPTNQPTTLDRFDSNRLLQTARYIHWLLYTIHNYKKTTHYSIEVYMFRLCGKCQIWCSIKILYVRCYIIIVRLSTEKAIKKQRDSLIWKSSDAAKIQAVIRLWYPFGHANRDVLNAVSRWNTQTDETYWMAGWLHIHIFHGFLSAYNRLGTCVNFEAERPFQIPALAYTYTWTQRSDIYSCYIKSRSSRPICTSVKIPIWKR